MAKPQNISKLKGFYTKAKDLRLVHSIEEFAKLLGYSRSQYHKMVAGEYPINDDTISAAEQIVAGETKAVSRETLLLEGLLKKQNTLMEMQNTLLSELKESLYDKVKNIESNLMSVRGQAEGIELELLSGRMVVLQSLARLEGKTDSYLLEKADNIKISLAEAKNEHYMTRKDGIAHNHPA